MLLVLLAATTTRTQAQGLEFRNSALESGVAGIPGAVYRFPLVAKNIDALVKITNRSSNKVKLLSIDLTNTGSEEAFQPQVTYGYNETPSNPIDWWMEFEISFVNAHTSMPVTVKNVDLTAMDIAGDGERINEWVSLYNLKAFTCDSQTKLGVASIWELLAGINSMVGKKFDGPVTSYDEIDTSSTEVMANANYENKSSFRLRTGAHSSGYSMAANRMYSFWFKSFSYEAPVSGPLPVKLSAFTAKKAEGKVVLNWSTEIEVNASHFVIERSLNGVNYTDAGLLFTKDNSTTRRNYSFTDDLKQVSGSIVYYRLKMVDMDGTYERSAVRIIRLAEEKDGNVSILAYPNPVVNELRVTLPGAWQDKPLVLDVLNLNGQVVKHLVQERAGQTQTIQVSDLLAGVYIVRASNGPETAIQRIVKSK
jgi:hypothetical protein